MAPKVHDADLCERIRELEKRIEELEAAPRTIYVPAPHWCYTGCPIHWPTYFPNTTTWTPPPPNTTITYGTTTIDGVTTSDTFTGSVS